MVNEHSFEVQALKWRRKQQQHKQTSEKRIEDNSSSSFWLPFLFWNRSTSQMQKTLHFSKGTKIKQPKLDNDQKHKQRNNKAATAFFGQLVSAAAMAGFFSVAPMTARLYAAPTRCSQDPL